MQRLELKTGQEYSSTMSLESLFHEEDRLRDDNNAKTSKADLAIQKAEDEFKALTGDVEESEEDKLRREDFLALEKRMGELKAELKTCRRAKNPRKNVEYNKRVGEKRKRITRDIEEIKIKLQDLQFEIQGSMMKSGDLMKMQTMTDDEKVEKKNEFKARMQEKREKMKLNNTPTSK